MEPLDQAHQIIEVFEAHKAEDIVLLDIQGLSVMCDYFVICSGTSDRQLKALADAVVDVIDGKRRNLLQNYAKVAQSGWILIDLGDVVVHIFTPEVRDYYDLESLWSQGKTLLHIQ